MNGEINIDEQNPYPLKNVMPSVDKIEVVEKSMRVKVDLLVPQIAENIGLSVYKWEELSYYGCIGFFVIACLIQFSRFDFVNVLLICYNFYQLALAAFCYYVAAFDRIKLESCFKYLLILLIVSEMYDLIWMGFFLLVSRYALIY